MDKPKPEPTADTMARLEKLKSLLGTLDDESLQSIGKLAEMMKHPDPEARLEYLKNNQDQLMKDRDRLMELFTKAGMLSPMEGDAEKPKDPGSVSEP